MGNKQGKYNFEWLIKVFQHLRGWKKESLWLKWFGRKLIWIWGFYTKSKKITVATWVFSSDPKMRLWKLKWICGKTLSWLAIFFSEVELVRHFRQVFLTVCFSFGLLFSYFAANGRILYPTLHSSGQNLFSQSNNFP